MYVSPWNGLEYFGGEWLTRYSTIAAIVKPNTYIHCLKFPITLKTTSVAPFPSVSVNC